MANIGESRTARLARERLKAIEKFLPVRDSVRKKLQARQQAEVEFATGAEELFKPVTAATETVKTAIVGKPDPDKPQQSLLQAIEELKKAKPIKGFNYKSAFTEEFVNVVKTAPVNTDNKDEVITFGTDVANAYHSDREKVLKDPDQKVTKQQFLDGVFKIKRGIERLDTSDEVYLEYMSGADRFDIQERQRKSGQKKTKKLSKNIAVTTPLIADPEKEQQKRVPRTKHQPLPEQQQEPN